MTSRMASLIRYALAKLRETGTKLKEPALSHAFDHWAADTASAQHDAAWGALQAQSKTLEAQLRQTRFENKKGTMLHVAQVIGTDGHFLQIEKKKKKNDPRRLIENVYL